MMPLADAGVDEEGAMKGCWMDKLWSMECAEGRSTKLPKTAVFSLTLSAGGELWLVSVLVPSWLSLVWSIWRARIAATTVINNPQTNPGAKRPVYTSDWASRMIWYEQKKWKRKKWIKRTFRLLSASTRWRYLNPYLFSLHQKKTKKKLKKKTVAKSAWLELEGIWWSLTNGEWNGRIILEKHAVWLGEWIEISYQRRTRRREESFGWESESEDVPDLSEESETTCNETDDETLLPTEIDRTDGPPLADWTDRPYFKLLSLVKQTREVRNKFYLKEDKQK